MANHGCWTIEYDWMVSLGSEPQSRETVLCVLFEDGAQRQFSSVRITLLYSSDTTPQHHHTWKIKPYSPPLSVVSRVPFESQDTFVTPNDPSLPICNIVFTANRHSARSQTISGVAKDCGELVLTETGPPKDFHNIMFEFDQPVSVSFTSSRLLCTMITHGVFSDPPSDHSTIVGRVVRVFPVDPASKHVLLLVFENLRFPPTYRGWRKDVLSSALVCREWTCALNALLADFRSEESQQGYPPEICRFASGLVARPSLGLGYLEKHPSWDPLPDFPPGRLSTMFLAKLQLRQGNPPLLSILSVAKNVQTLCLDPGMDLVVHQTISRTHFEGVPSPWLNYVSPSLNVLPPPRHPVVSLDALVRSPGEEHALDATITRMERLTMLKIRRAEAFKQRSTPALSEVHLHLLMAGEPEDHSLIAAASRVWPGWEMAQTGWACGP
ncbi:hypothetical protein EV363DRAFT_1329841 [Boletus edulis]|nr:hypothetical protein EV363DRAFT_1329841 [Boletus edulis]